MNINVAKDLLDELREGQLRMSKILNCNPEGRIEKADYAWFVQMIKCKEFQSFAKENGSELTNNIINTIESKQDNKYFYVTGKMSSCITDDLMSKFTADEVLAILLEKDKKEQEEKEKIIYDYIFIAEDNTETAFTCKSDKEAWNVARKLAVSNCYDIKKKTENGFVYLDF